MRVDSNIKSKSLNDSYLDIIKIFNKLFKKLNIIELQNLITTSTLVKYQKFNNNVDRTF